MDKNKWHDGLFRLVACSIPATAANTKVVLKETPTSCSDNPTAMSACGGQICNFRRNPRSVAGVTEDEALSLIHDIAAVACYSFEVMMHCGYYYFLVKAILEGKQDNLPLADLLSKGLEDARNYYKDNIVILNLMRGDLLCG